MASPSSDLYEFGPCRVDAGQRVLTRDGHRVTLAPKTFDLLLLLVRYPGRAFSKQELMTALWPDTFVEEGNLSFQMSTLRKALGDGASAWIETLPKHGYRFAAEVIASPQLPAASSSERVGLPVAGGRADTRSWFLVGVLVLVTVATATYVIGFRARPGQPVELAGLIATPLTAYPGIERAPSLSPDGTQVAFSWNGPRQDNYDIYVKLVGPGEPVRLTTGPEQDTSPAWSPDGQRVAFMRLTGEQRGDVFVMPALGGAERQLGTVFFPNSSPLRWRTISWSRDGKWLAIGGRLSIDGATGLWLFEVDGPARRRLTSPATSGWQGDAVPVFSPDGRRIAFIRAKSMSSNAIFTLALSSALTPAEEPVQVFSDPRRGIVALAWTPDSRALVYSWGGHVAPTRLARISVPPESGPSGPPELLPFGERATEIAVGRTGRLVYSAELRDTNFWKLDLTWSGSVPEDAGLSSSTLDETTPSHAPDGRRVVFTSTRSGSEELWISNVDGSELRQMTSMGGPLCANPQWSPDGRSILFNSTREGTNDLYLLFPGTGEVRRLTTDPTDEVEAYWSRDGRWIYFGSNRTGGFQVWKMPVDGGAATQITRGGGDAGQESLDGRFLYYAKAANAFTIWRVPLGGGEESQVLDRLSYSKNFVVGERGIYFVAAGDTRSNTSIDFFEFSTGRRTTLATIGKPWWFGITLSPDQRWLLFPTTDRDGRDLMVVDDFK